MSIIAAKRAGLMSLVLFGLLCATAQGQQVTGNNAAFGNGPIVTVDLPEGTIASFIPDGAAGRNGRGVLVLGNKVYYTELANRFGPTDNIRVAPFNGGSGGSDNPAWTLSNPRPDCGVQDLAYHDGYVYALTGYLILNFPSSPCPGEGGGNLQVFKIAVGGTAWSAPVTINGPAESVADGFTILVNNGILTFLINDGDASCTYREYNSTTGSPTGNFFTMPFPEGPEICSGVDTLDSNTASPILFFARPGSGGLTTATLTTTPSWSLSTPVTVRPGLPWNVVEDISLVHGFDGTPGAANCHGKSVSDLAKTYGGMPNAASALGYSGVADLQAAITAFCGN
jgi:hypothetical protein